jgi:hypothetical protein
MLRMVLASRKTQAGSLCIGLRFAKQNSPLDDDTDEIRGKIEQPEVPNSHLPDIRI